MNDPNPPTTDESAEAGARRRRQIFGYFLALYLTTGIAGGGFMGIPQSFLLKNQLKLGAQEIALFHLILAIPLYFGFVFGFVRDRWSPFGMRDRGYLLLFGPFAGLSYLVLAGGHVTYARLLGLMILVTICFRFIAAAMSALTAIVGQAHWMSGRLSTLSNVVSYCISAIMTLAGGLLAERVDFRILLVVGAALTFGIFAIGWWKPASVFTGRELEPPLHRQGWSEVVRLARYWPIWPPVVIWLIWQCTPAGFTAVLFFLTDTVKLTPAQFGLFNAIISIAFVPTMLLYGYLCKRYSMRKLLFWSAIVGAPQWILVIFIHTPVQAMVVAATIGLMGGAATAAYFDLIIRSCPVGLEGAAMLLADAGLAIGIRLGDVLGSSLFKWGGFDLTAWVTTAMYVAIVPILFLVPKSITEHREAMT